uniref:Protein kinase domain-containing protein n=1 Tax=Panagrolaimus sp. JU765 TaxID=591449 RepID=A0AC34Q8W5_9BILA
MSGKNGCDPEMLQKINLRQIGALENPAMSSEDNFDDFEESPSVSDLLPEKNNVIRGQKNAYAVGRKLAPGRFGAVYEVLRKSDGRFGAVYEVLRKSDGRQFAAKLEVCTESFNGLNMDYKVLKAAEKSKCSQFAELVDRGKIDGHFKFIVIQMLGENLWKLRHQFVEHRFSAPTALKLALETLKGIEQLHSLGFVHRDIKPSNFLMHKTDSGTRIVIIDFGICRPFRTSNGDVRPPREQCHFRGTTRYASLAAHNEQEQSPKDDLESWFYLVVETINGNLPWAEYRKNDRELVKTLKQNVRNVETTHQFLKHCPKVEFRRILSYLDGLTYFSQPDYNYLRQLINLAMKNNKIDPDEPYDWEIDQEKPVESNNNTQTKLMLPVSDQTKNIVKSLEGISMKN